jgi:hypothetical protein
MHLYLVTLAGWFIYNFFIFNLAKDVVDKNDEDFHYAGYLKHNWDNWVLSLSLSPVLVSYLPDILGIINDWTSWNLKPYAIYYLGVGVLVELIYYLIYKYILKRDYSLIAPTGKPRNNSGDSN